MPQAGDIIHDKYRILAPIGGGAMGLVFSAVHVATEKRVALKWLNPAIASMPGSAERFQREARATGRIHHPNVVAVHDVGEHEGQPYLAMEYLAGPTLRAHLTAAANGRLPLEASLGLLFPIMRGVAAAHAAGVLHRDLKPENVVLAELPDGLGPIPKVLDFGLAKVRSETSGITKLSMPGSVLGTYQYMAPEQFRSSEEVTERVDVYALGAMLYEMLSGEPPYRADNPVDLVLQIHAAEPPPLATVAPTLPTELTPVVARAVAREPAARFASVEDFAVALEPFTRLHRFRGSGTLRADAHVPALPEQPKPHSPTQLFELGIAPLATAIRAHARDRQQGPRRTWARALLGAAALFLQPGSQGAAKTQAEAPAADSGEKAAPWPLATSVAAPAPDPPKPSRDESDWAAAPANAASDAVVPVDAAEASTTTPNPAHAPDPSKVADTKPTENAAARNPERAPRQRHTSSEPTQARPRTAATARPKDGEPPAAGAMKAYEF